MKKYYSIELGTANLNSIKAEKAQEVAKLNKYLESLKKNPRYYNICKGNIQKAEERIQALNKEAKDSRRYIRKAKAMVAA